MAEALQVHSIPPATIEHWMELQVGYTDHKVASAPGASPTVVSGVLASSAWSGGEQIISNTSIAANSVIAVSPAHTATATERNAFGNARLYDTAQTGNSLSIKCGGVVPTVDIPITVVIFH